MSSFSFLAPFKAIIGPGEGQIAEPGTNEDDNCGPACGSALMQLLGYGDIEPQTWINQMPGYGPIYHGGTTLQALNAFIATHYPNPPPMFVESVADPAGAVENWGAQGLVSIGWFYCDSQANIKPYPTRISHYCLVLASDGTILTVWNPWGNGRFDQLTHDQFNRASLRTFDVCQRPIKGGVNAMAGSEVRVPQEDALALRLTD